MTVPLVRLCYGRSGDKGDTANVGVVARSRDALPFLRACLTEERVATWFAHVLQAPGEGGEGAGAGAGAARHGTEAARVDATAADAPLPPPRASGWVASCALRPGPRSASNCGRRDQERKRETCHSVSEEEGAGADEAGKRGSISLPV